ncbi:LiaF transmembrane domain-containing protein [Xanthovirga aplysinae]|uniref:LiaF transmembrane domain-containing protein n=1 Tax=Xanthovirga aplysinae TaxID=2529853 RepID=UPI0012BC922F|nr:LiaF domain-containing protein [Xanthovirga aplysinae]MTI30470.1 hypothetical protein [Xanthovirga aplysinae]
MRNYNTGDRSSRIGLLFLIFGVLFLLNNFHLLPLSLSYLVFNWRGFILLIGIVLLVSKPNKLPGIVMISIAVYFISVEYLWHEFGINIGLRRIFWPALLIGSGYLLLKKKELEGKRRNVESSFEFLNGSNVMGGGEVKVQSQNFRGGKVSAIFGGASYDMSGSQLAEGRNTLDVLAIFGGFTFIVPSDWDIQLEVTTLFGELSDKRKYIKPTTSGNNKKLRIKGFILFGGGEIKNY